jgi:quercetin dioxygenase-like cupin family protein
MLRTRACDFDCTLVCYRVRRNSVVLRFMKTPRTLLAATAILVAVGAFPSQSPGIRRIELQRHALTAPGREVVQVRVEFDAGASFGRHRHPGEEIVNVLSGSLEYVLEGRPPITLQAGDVLFVPAGVIHSARNVGSVTGAELATYIVEKGKPLLVMED